MEAVDQILVKGAYGKNGSLFFKNLSSSTTLSLRGCFSQQLGLCMFTFQRHDKINIPKGLRKEVGFI